MVRSGSAQSVSKSNIGEIQNVLRLSFSAFFVLAQSVLFIVFFYKSALGGETQPVIPHIALSLVWVLLIYSSGSLIALLSQAWLRHALLGLIGVITVLLTTVFYLTTMACFRGFRDLPTYTIVKEYFTEIPAAISSIPLSPFLLFVGTSVVALFLLLLSASVGWSLSGLRLYVNRINVRSFLPLIMASWLSLCATIAAIQLVDPSFYYEPWCRSLADRPLANSSLSSQENPVETGIDRQLEASYPIDPMGRRLNVFLIYIDGLRADVLQSYGAKEENMPFISSLVESGELVQFPRVFAGSSMTIGGLGTILQSRPAHRISPKAFSLPKALHKQGYDTRFLLSGKHRTFLTLGSYYDPHDFYYDGGDLESEFSTDDFAIFRQLSNLPTAVETTKPQFMMFGLYSAHVWGKRHSDFRRWKPDKLTTTSFLSLKENSMTAYRNNYMNGILQTDWVLKEIWSWLEESGYLRDSIVVITSDHGESLGENGHVGHAQSLGTPELLIPLWIHDPTSRIAKRDLAFQQDISPTILALLDLPRPSSWTGLSLLDPQPAERVSSLFYMNSRDKFGIIQQRDGRTLKYTIDRKLDLEQVFDLDVDLLDKDDLSKSLSEYRLKELRSLLRSSFGGMLD